MFTTILCQRDFKEISAVVGHICNVFEWNSDEQLKKLISDGEKILLITDKTSIKPDLYNLSKLEFNSNIAFHHYCEEVEAGDGHFPGVSELTLCKDFYKDSGIYFVIDGDFGALPTFEKELLFTVEDYISFDQYKPAFFFDRDGVINVDHSYVHKIEDLDYKDGINEFMTSDLLKDYSKFIVTNQSGVARKKFTLEDVRIFNEAITDHFKSLGVNFLDVQVAPYHFDKGIEEFKWHSLTRKPFPGMVLKICHSFPVDLEKSWMIGDKVSDHLEMKLLNFVHIDGSYDLSNATAPVVENFSQIKDLVK